MEKTRFLSAKIIVKTLIVSGMVMVFGVTSASALVKVGFVDMQKAITSTKSFKKAMTKISNKL